jgi:hypothetical protein
VIRPNKGVAKVWALGGEWEQDKKRRANLIDIYVSIESQEQE